MLCSLVIGHSVAFEGPATDIRGKPLEKCGPEAGGMREDGYCVTDGSDSQSNVVCAEISDAFLRYTKQTGNDMMVPEPKKHFPGLRAGQKWCLCVHKWEEAYRATKRLGRDVTPRIVAGATHPYALEYVDIDVLDSHSVEHV